MPVSVVEREIEKRLWAERFGDGADGEGEGDATSSATGSAADVVRALGQHNRRLPRAIFMTTGFWNVGFKKNVR